MTKKAVHVTTAAHFAAFKKECEIARIRWGVNDWDVFYEHADMSPREFGEAAFDHTARSAVIRLAKGPPDEPSAETLKDTAREEMVHVVLGEMTCLMMTRCVTQDQCDAAVEAVTKRLKRLLP